MPANQAIATNTLPENAMDRTCRRGAHPWQRLQMLQDANLKSKEAKNPSKAPIAKGKWTHCFIGCTLLQVPRDQHHGLTPPPLWLPLILSLKPECRMAIAASDTLGTEPAHRQGILSRIGLWLIQSAQSFPKSDTRTSDRSFSGIQVFFTRMDHHPGFLFWLFSIRIAEMAFLQSFSCWPPNATSW